MDGFTACQMDIKALSMSFDILKELLEQAKVGIQHILEKMNSVLNKPRDGVKPHVPVIQQFFIKPSMMGIVIGPKGKMIQQIQQTTNTTIQLSDEGEISVFAPNKKAGQQAYDTIQALVSEPEIEKIYTGKIKSLTSYGAFVEFLPQKEGLLHVTEMSDNYIADPSKCFEVGQEVKVRLISIIKPKERNGRTKFGLSSKKLN